LSKSKDPEELCTCLPQAKPLPKNQGIDIKTLFSYKHPLVKQIIWQIKYKKDDHAIQFGGYALWKSILNSPEYKTILSLIIIPIPTSRQRLHERGYNQCERLAREIIYLNQKKSDSDIPKIIVRADILYRKRHTSRQTMKNKKQRELNNKDIFAVRRDQASLEENTPVLVIDDVITTGNTILEAIRVLRISGYKHVKGLAFAH
jgi:predicted amidophosphoribosyltransferase